MSAKALVSAIIPAYNHERYVQAAIRSLIEQTYANIELIVIDDGSSDATWERICALRAECEARFVRVCLETKENEGTCVTLNKLLQRARGKYVYLMASDDMAKPQAIATEAGFLEAHPDYCLAVGDNAFIDADGQRIYWDNERRPVVREQEICYASFGHFFRQTRKDVDFLSDDFGSYASLYFRNYITNGYTIRKATLDSIGAIPELGVLEDYYLMLQLAKYGKFKYIDEILFSYRWHATNTMKNFGFVDMHEANTRAVEALVLKDRKRHPRREFTPEFTRWLQEYDPDYPAAALSVDDPAHLKLAGSHDSAAPVEVTAGSAEADFLFKVCNTNPAFPDGAWNCCVQQAAPEFTRRRLAIFASRDASARVDATVLHYLRALREVVDAILFVADNPILPEELERLRPLASCIFCCECGVSGFGAYRVGYLYAERQGYLEQVDTLILCDDSCLGPVAPLAPVFVTMTDRPCDFWTLLESPDGQMPSWFFVAARPLVAHEALARYFHNCDAQGWVRDGGDLGGVLAAAGFRGDAYIRRREIAGQEQCLWRSGTPDLLLWPLTLLEQGMPLVRLLARDGGLAGNLQENPYTVLDWVQERQPVLGAALAARLERECAPHDAHWRTPGRLLPAYDVIFFNVLETLLAYPFARPEDVFAYIEERTGRAGFAVARQRAEENSRAVAGGEAGLALVYADAALRDFQDMRDVELEALARLLFADARAKVFYDEAVRLGKRIVLLADTCLPAQNLRGLLQRAGYAHFEALHVSCAAGSTRASGALYRHALREAGVAREQVLHIGSRWAQDRDMPASLGLRAHIIDPFIWEFRHHLTHFKFWIFHRRVHSLLSGMLLALWARYLLRQEGIDPFAALGYCLGGPFVLGYCRCIRQCCEEDGIDALVFAGPAGGILRRAYTTLYGTALPMREAPRFREPLWDPLPAGAARDAAPCLVAAGVPPGEADALTPVLDGEALGERVALVQCSTRDGMLLRAAQARWGENVRRGIAVAYRCGEAEGAAPAALALRCYAHDVRSPRQRVMLAFVETLLGEGAPVEDDSPGTVLERENADALRRVRVGIERFVADYVAVYGDMCPDFACEEYLELVQALREQYTLADALVLRRVHRPGCHAPLTRLSLHDLLVSGGA